MFSYGLIIKIRQIYICFCSHICNHTLRWTILIVSCKNSRFDEECREKEAAENDGSVDDGQCVHSNTITRIQRGLQGSHVLKHGLLENCA